EISSSRRFMRRWGAAALLCAKGIPGVLKGDASQFFRGLLKIPLAMGGLKAALRPESTSQHVAYTGNGEQKVAFLTNIISPYRKPVFERLHETPEWDFTVYADARREFDRQWDVASESLKVIYPKCLSWKRKVKSTEPVLFEQTITLHIPFGLFWCLFRDKPQTVISLELGLRTAIAAFYCTLTRRKLIIWAYQSRIIGTQGRSRLLWRKFLLGRAHRVVGMGIQAREVLRGWGVPDEKIVDALNAADHVTLAQKLSEPDAESRCTRILDENAPQKKLAIVVGRLIPLKGVEYLLDIWNQLPSDLHEQWQLVFLGDGPLSSLITNAPHPSITWKGPIPTDDMAYWYKAADLHIFPTCGDVWGLVVNEASEAGTPTLCSIHAGCSDNLIHPGVDGLLFDPTRKDEAGLALQNALQNPELNRLGESARKTVSSYTLDQLAQSFRNAASAT
ncbi:MAG: glycosyltransferase family 4 protein, partial [Puniceicoccales bacterium]